MEKIQRKEIRSGWKKDRMLEDEGGAGALLWQRRARWASWARLNSGGKHARCVKHNVGRCGTSKRSMDAARRTAPKMRAA